ncbi:hypothetical protein [Kribbella deserti]|uniref:Uncharacterized protein n=1 Tax=Kribbella deserti TaxID=1926257 RepID=A0ABV6QED5_9ACTN
MTEDRSDLFGLGEVISADLCRRNAFRLSGLPVDATARQMRRRGDEVQAAERLGLPVQTTAGVLPLDPPPDAEAVRAAILRLRDPVQRLVEELFWFWPSPSDGQDTDEARRTWLALAHDGSGDADVRVAAKHNLAVLELALALEPPLDLDRWLVTYEWWKKALNEGGFERWIERRIKALDDPRLSPAMAARLAKEVPVALVRLHAELVMLELQRNEDFYGESDPHLDHMALACPDPVALRMVLEEVTRPMAARVRARCEQARMPADDPAVLHERADELLTCMDAEFDYLGAMLGYDSTLVMGLRDELAGLMRTCAVKIANYLLANEVPDRGDQGKRVLRYLELAWMSDPADQIRTRIEDDTAVVADNVIRWLADEALVKVAAEPARALVIADRLIAAAQPVLRRHRQFQRDAAAVSGVEQDFIEDLASILLAHGDSPLKLAQAKLAAERIYQSANLRTTFGEDADQYLRFTLQYLEDEPPQTEPFRRETLQPAPFRMSSRADDTDCWWCGRADAPVTVTVAISPPPQTHVSNAPTEYLPSCVDCARNKIDTAPHNAFGCLFVVFGLIGAVTLIFFLLGLLSIWEPPGGTALNGYISAAMAVINYSIDRRFKRSQYTAAVLRTREHPDVLAHLNRGLTVMALKSNRSELLRP